MCGNLWRDGKRPEPTGDHAAAATDIPELYCSHHGLRHVPGASPPGGGRPSVSKGRSESLYSSSRPFIKLKYCKTEISIYIFYL